MAPNPAPGSRWEVLNTLILRLTPRTLGLLLTLSLLTFTVLLLFAMQTGGTVSFLGFEYSRQASVEPPPPGLTVEELSQLAGQPVTPDEFVELHASHHDSLAVFEAIKTSAAYQFLVLEKAIAQKGGSINTTLAGDDRASTYRLIQQALRLAGIPGEIDGDRANTQAALTRFQELHNERAKRDSIPPLAPLGTLGRRTLKAMQDSYYALNQNA
jgi:hypothetical protein